MITLRHGAWTATVNALGASLASLHHGDRAVVLDQDDPERQPPFRGAVLVPWVNRLADGAYTFDGIRHTTAVTEPEHANALHGLGLGRRWNVEQDAAASASLVLACGPVDGYPFAVAAAVTYTLRDAGLAVRIDAHNAGEVSAPFAAGFHPYLVAASSVDETVLRLSASRRMLSDERRRPVELTDVADGPYDFRAARPVGDLVLDDAFTWLCDGVIDYGDLRLTVSPELAWVHLFTPPDRQSLAVEPCTSAPDAFNSGAGLVVLAPGESFAAAWSLTVRRPDDFVR